MNPCSMRISIQLPLFEFLRKIKFRSTDFIMTMDSLLIGMYTAVMKLMTGYFSISTGPLVIHLFLTLKSLFPKSVCSAYP
jgi:hypothetical protein